MIPGRGGPARTLCVVGRPVWVFVVAVLMGVAASACSRSTAAEVTIGRAGSPPSTTSTTTVESPSTPVAFSVSFDVEGPGRADSVEAVKAAVVRTFDRYLEAGVLTPLRSGGPAGDLRPLFTARAAEHMWATDRNAFVDEGLPPASRIVAEASGLRLAGLAEPGGDVVLVSARMDLKLVSGAEGATITIERGADLLLVAEGDEWKIDSYQVRVSRDTPDSFPVVAGA